MGDTQMVDAEARVKLAELERKVAELERRLAELERQAAQAKAAIERKLAEHGLDDILPW